MKKISILILFLSVIFHIGCNEEKKQNTNKNTLSEKKSTPTANFEHSIKNISKETLKNCKTNICPEIDIAYLHLIENNNTAKKINRTNQKVLSSITLAPNDSVPEENLELGLSKFVEDYVTFKNDYPDSHIVYEIDIKQDPLFENDSILVYSTTFYTYTGGAHGYGAKRFSTYNKTNGNKIETEALLKNKEAFKAYAEGMFRKKFKLSEQESLNKNGFFFENDKFKLAENIAVTKDSLFMIYNAYEAASYAEGDIKFSFPKEDVKSWLNY